MNNSPYDLDTANNYEINYPEDIPFQFKDSETAHLHIDLHSFLKVPNLIPLYTVNNDSLSSHKI